LDVYYRGGCGYLFKPKGITEKVMEDYRPVIDFWFVELTPKQWYLLFLVFIA